MNQTFQTLDTKEKSFVELLLADYDELLQKSEEPLSDNFEYMRLTELRFLIKK